MEMLQLDPPYDGWNLHNGYTAKEEKPGDDDLAREYAATERAHRQSELELHQKILSFALETQNAYLIHALSDSPWLNYRAQRWLQRNHASLCSAAEEAYRANALHPLPSISRGNDGFCNYKHAYASASADLAYLDEPDAHIVYVATPLYNEVANIDARRLGQLARHRYPTYAVFADNNSSDGSGELAASLGINVRQAPLQGIGPARQVALDTILSHKTPVPANRQIIFQNDADSLVTNYYLDGALEFITNSDKDVFIGSTEYHLAVDERVARAIPELTVEDVIGPGILQTRASNAQAYRRLVCTLSLRGYFKQLGYDAADFMLEAPFRYIPGPHAFYRGSLFESFDYRYPLQIGQWEQLDLSVRLQMQRTSKSTIEEIPKKLGFVYASARGVLRNSVYIRNGGFSIPYLSYEDWLVNRAEGVKPYGTRGRKRSLTALASMSLTIGSILRETYELTPGESVDGYAANRHDAESAVRRCRQHRQHELRPAVHAGDGRPLGKIAIIGGADPEVVSSMEPLRRIGLASLRRYWQQELTPRASALGDHSGKC